MSKLSKNICKYYTKDQSITKPELNWVHLK